MEIHPDDHVATISTWPVATLSPRATLRDAARTLAQAKVGAVVVLPESGAPLGLISERDIVRALAEGANPDEVWAADVMSEEPRYATPGQSIRSAAHEMLAAGFRHLPVMDDNELVGIVAARDALRVLADAAPVRPAVIQLPEDGRAVERELAHPGG